MTFQPAFVAYLPSGRPPSGALKLTEGRTILHCLGQASRKKSKILLLNADSLFSPSLSKVY